MTSTTAPTGLDRFLREATAVLPRDALSIEDVQLDRYTSDSYWKALAYRDRGQPLGRPWVVATPTTEEQIPVLLQLAARHRIPVVPWGGGSGSQGGAVPTQGGLVIDLRNLAEVVELDEESGIVSVQAGANGAEFEAWLNARGYTFPHYPASAEWATVGGYVAARGSGVLSTRYGKIEDLTVSIRLATPEGRLIDLLPAPRHAVGPDLASLIIGSEGALGVITRVTLQVMPQPTQRLFACVAFDNTRVGVDAYRDVMIHGFRPAVVRLYDEVATQHTLRPVLQSAKTSMSEQVVSIMTFEGEGGLAQAERDGTLDLCRQHSARVLDPQFAEHWWEHRYDFYRPPFYPQLPNVWGTFDIVAPYKTLMSAYDALQESVAIPFAKYGLQLRTHFSHWYQWGAMYYARFVMPDPGPDVLEIHEQIWREGMDAVVAAGGMINDHHGVGLKLAPWMRAQHGEALDLLREVKRAFDPHGVMNPGKLDLDAP
ncbi:MAG: FAD-binding oxidoreductase [Beutenbergiaceae bacterium]